MKRLARPIASRNRAETAVPMTPPMPWNSSSRPCIAAAVAAITIEASTTTVEWPSEKKKPAECGDFPSCISLRTTLSMAAMWSASNAWRSPNI
jgi:hypothetical protein